MLHPFDVPTQEELLSPYMLGQLDAEEGKLCIPEVYYVRRMEQRDYCRGYAHIAGDTLTTRQFLANEA